MSRLAYSIDARNVINLFYGVDKVVYVEGDDDIPFWETIFDKLANFTVQIEEVGGKEEVAKYIEDILSGDANYLIAKDSDYETLNDSDEHPNIINTYGHSIENSIINSSILNSVLRNLCRIRSNQIPHNLSNDWLNHISQALTPLVHHDIVNEQDQLGTSVITKNCTRFLVSPNGCEFCSYKIQSYLDRISSSFSQQRLDEVAENIEESDLTIYEIIRGHFLFSAVFHFIKESAEHLRRRTSISLDMLYSNLMSTFEHQFNDSHPHYEFYREKVQNITL